MMFFETMTVKTPNKTVLIMNTNAKLFTIIRGLNSIQLLRSNCLLYFGMREL